MQAHPISPTERLILLNQYRILALVDPQNAYEHEQNAEIVQLGYEEYFDQLFSALRQAVPEETTREAQAVLDMFRNIDNALARLSTLQQNELDLGILSFRGFDERTPHARIAEYLVKKRGYYEELRNRALSNHDSYTTEGYRKMLKVFEEEASKHPMREIGLSQLKRIQDAYYAKP